jgi:hypothetical protein
MIYLKSLLAGLLVVVGASAALAVFVIAAIILYAAFQPEGVAVGWDPMSLMRRPPVWLVLFIVFSFCVGALWEYRRLAR